MTENAVRLDKKGPRESNLELLRIVSMFMIVLSHYALHGFVIDTAPGFNRDLAQYVWYGGKVGVLAFIFISGYFAIRPTIKKFFLLLFEIAFYSAGVSLILVRAGLVDPAHLTWEDFLPVMTGRYWFATAYVMLYIFAPVLNAAVAAFEKKAFKNVLIALFLACSVFDVVSFNRSFMYSSFTWFVFVYLVGGYIKKYPQDFSTSVWKPLAWCAAIWLAVCTGRLALYYLYTGPNLTYWADRIGSLNMPWVFACALFLFIAFKNMRMKPSAVINFLGASQFGIYLIHDQESLRTVLYTGFLQIERFYYSPWLTPVMLGSCLLIMAACSAVDIARIYALEKPISYVWDKIFAKKEKQS